MPEVRIKAEPRTEFGKGASRAIRREGRVPAVMYGHGAENRHFTLPEHELMLALKTPNALIRVEGLPGRAMLALPKAVQRHAIKGVIEHVDLIEVRSGEKVTVEIPIRVTGEAFSGGILHQQMVQLSVEARPPTSPTASTSTSRARRSAPRCSPRTWTLPKGTTLAGDPEALVLHVIEPRSQAQFDEEIGEGGEEAGTPVEVPPALGAAEAAE